MVLVDMYIIIIHYQEVAYGATAVAYGKCLFPITSFHGGPPK